MVTTEFVAEGREHYWMDSAYQVSQAWQNTTSKLRILNRHIYSIVFETFIQKAGYGVLTPI